MTLALLAFLWSPFFGSTASFAQTPTLDDSHSYLQWSDQILSDFSEANWRPEVCVPLLRELATKLDQLEPSASTDLQNIAPTLMDRLWHARLELHDRIEGSNDDCVREIRNTFRRFRFLEDFLGEISFHPENLDPDTMDFSAQPVPIDEAAPGYLLQTRDPDFHLQPGDVILARGVSFLSAMIARLGDVDSQFSHVVFVTENPDTHQIETIESYVGVGVDLYDRKTALQNENARLLVLRPKDHALAERASEQMRAFVKAHQGIDKIHYDYALDFNDHTTMSCAEVAQVAFLNASNESFTLPERASTLSRGLNLVKSLGIRPGNTFTPGDLEADSRFDIVAEWRDLRLTRDSRMRDAIFSKVVQWMDERGYVLHPNLTAKLARGLIYDLRRTFLWPLVRKALKVDDFSKEVPRSMVGTVALLNPFGEGLLHELKQRDEAQEAKTGIPMTYLDLDRALEELRTRDESLFARRKTRKQSLILRFLRF